MKVRTIDGKDYRLPVGPTPFQLDMYVHLINWKWKNITREPGYFDKNLYDARLPEAMAEDLPVIYPPVVNDLRAHWEKFHFRLHNHFNHMASSQAANVNLFLPVLLHPNVDTILRAINPGFGRLATDHLDRGYRFEFWDEDSEVLGDKTKISGTDSDLAIAYHNRRGELCLWLVEHKLTEKEFTTCGGFRSRGRQPRHDCSRSFADILNEKSICYYHDVRKFRYWDITAANRGFFPNHARHAHCPFRGGMCQLWRNQLLALGVEQDDQQPYKHAHFSVVKHPRNPHLEGTLNGYKEMIGGNPKFSEFTSADVVRAAEARGDDSLRDWAGWYRDLYRL